MSYRLTPQDIVTMLESLQKVEMMADQAEPEPVKGIKNKLELIKGYYPNLTILETKIIEEFKEIGSNVSSDDVLIKHDGATKVKQRLQSIDDILSKIKKITKKIEYP